MIRTSDLAARTAEHWAKLLTDLIIANGLCYDGQNFFDTDHVTLASGTLQNDLDATDIPALNISTAAAPTATVVNPLSPADGRSGWSGMGLLVEQVPGDLLERAVLRAALHDATEVGERRFGGGGVGVGRREEGVDGGASGGQRDHVGVVDDFARRAVVGTEGDGASAHEALTGENDCCHDDVLGE
jgi:hypothetical protein